MESKKTNVLSQYGLMSAVVGVLLLVILYLGGTSLFTSPVAYLGYAVPIVFAVLACLKQKKLNGGFLTFAQALKISFGVFVITSLATSLLSYVLFNFVDVAFSESMKQVAIERTQKIMERFNAPQSSIDKAINDMTKGNMFSLGKIFQGFAFSCILWFIISLIISAIVKKKKPEFPQATA